MTYIKSIKMYQYHWHVAGVSALHGSRLTPPTSSFAGLLFSLSGMAPTFLQ